MEERKIVNFYIECESQTDQARLESILSKQGYPFYNASKLDDYCNDGSSLEDVERELEGK